MVGSILLGSAVTPRRRWTESVSFEWRFTETAARPRRSSAGGAGSTRCGAVAAAVEDVGAAEVLERIAPDVDEAAERPDGVEQPRDRGVQLVGDRRVGHQRRLRVVEECPEPGTDAHPE